MREKSKNFMIMGFVFMMLFIAWTILISFIDVKPVGVNGSDIGFATFNCWIHDLTGVHMSMYVITDWLGLVPIFICMCFGLVGLIQLIRRRSLFKVDYDIIALGLFYIIVIICYYICEVIPINYRPILINGVAEVSYPSSTTLLVLCVMSTCTEQINRRLKITFIKRIINVSIICFSFFMILGRLFSGVHWFTDIIGSIILSYGLFCIYISIILRINPRKTNDTSIQQKN